MCPFVPHEGWVPACRGAVESGFEGSTPQMLVVVMQVRTFGGHEMLVRVNAIRLSPGVCDQLGSRALLTRVVGVPPAAGILRTELPRSKSLLVNAIVFPSRLHVGWLSPPPLSSNWGVPKEMPVDRSTP